MGKACRLALVIVAGWIPLLSTLMAAESAIQPPPPVAPSTQNVTADLKPVVGTGTITGVVVANDSGAPVKRVSVAASGGTILDPTTGRPPARGTAVQVQPMAGNGRGTSYGMVYRTTETDAGGHFSFTGLPAGRFSIGINVRSGFVGPAQETAQLADGGTAFERSSTGVPAYDPEALERLRARATFVTVRVGESAHVDLKTVRQ